MKKANTLLTLVLGVAAFVTPLATAQAAIFEPGFEVETVASGFILPTSMAFSPDGRIFVAEKSGVVRVVKNGAVLPTPAITLTDVNTFGDRGLIGIATDPDFLDNGYLYLSYTYENTPGANFSGPKTARIVRVTVVGDVADEASKVVLVGTIGGSASTPSCDNFAITDDCIPSNSSSHSAGGLRFGLDSKLYATMGDGANFDFVDPNSLKAQNVDSLAGKVLRINTDGTGPSDNPFYSGNPNDNRSKVYALGMRNAFRFNVNPITGNMYFGDVGWSSWEEIDLLTAGANFGWPCREGNTDTTHNCTPSSSSTDPLYTYPHNAAGAGSVTAGAFPANGVYPAAYDTSLFFGDYAQNFIKRLVLNATGDAVVSVEDFMDNPNGPVDISTGPDGNVYYIAIYTGDLMRITHTTGNRHPVAVVSANPTSGLTPLTVAFSSAGSADPDGDALSYLWNFGDGTTSTDPNPSHDYTVDGTYNATLQLTDSFGSTDSKSVTITAGNQAPTAFITSPSSGSLYTPFDEIQLTGEATDPEDGDLPASAFHWEVILHHNTHIHHIEDFTNTKNPVFTAPDHAGEDIYTEILLTVTDSTGLTASRSINLYLNSGSGNAGNLITNPSVETEDTNPILPLGWTNGWYGVLNPTFTYPAPGIEGAKAVKLVLTSYTSGSAKWFFSPVFVTPGEVYDFHSHYTATVDTVQTAQFGYPDGTYQYQQMAALPPTIAAGHVEYSITVPAGVQTLTVMHELAAVGELVTDDYSLTLHTGDPDVDTTPPNATITAPANGATVSGTDVVVTANASDNVGVAGVKLIIDGADMPGEDTENPYAFVWNSTSVADGPHTITVRARDPSGHVFTANPVTVTVQNGSTTPPAANLIQNPSLETVGGNGDPANWLRGGWGTNTRVFTYPTPGIDGASAAKVEITAYTDGDAKWFFSDVAVTGGNKYVFSHDYKSTVDSEILARWTLSGGTTQYQFLGAVPASAGWTTSQYNVTAPANAVSVTVFHLIHGVGSLEIDHFSLTNDDAVPPPPPPASSNLIQNPSLETVGGNGDPANWLRGGWGTNTRVFTYPTPGIDGASAAKVEITAFTSGDAKWYFTDAPVTPDTTYHFSHQYKSTVGTEILARWTLTGGTTQYQYLGALAAAADWTQSSYDLTAPANAESLTVFHVIGAVGSLEIDNFSLTPPDTGSTDSLIPNGDFETANGAAPLDWNFNTWGDHTAVGTYPVTGWNGGKAVRTEITVYSATGTGDAKWTFAPIAITPGIEYTYTDHYRSNTISDIIGQYTLSDGSFHYFGLKKEIQPSATWQTATGTFTPPADATHVTLFHLISAVGFVEIDDATMTAGGAGVPSETNAPIVEFTNPLQGQTVSGIVNLTASSTDDTAVTYIFYAVDGIPITGQLPNAPYTFAWDTTAHTNGVHTLKATTHDPFGNNSTHTITVTVNNPVVPPPSTTNLIQNPSLETDGGAGVPTGWQKGGWGTNDRIFTYPVQGIDGAKAAKIQMTTYTSGDAKWFFNPVSVTPDHLYTLETQYRSNVITNITIRYTMTDGTTKYVGVANPPAAADWTPFTYTWSPPVGAASMTVMHILSAVGTLEVDDYNLYEGTSAHFDKGMVSLTFDDGWLSQYTAGLPILEAANTKASFYIITNEMYAAGVAGAELIDNNNLETLGGNGDPVNFLRGGWGTNDRTFSVVPGETGGSAAKVAITNYTNGDAKWYFTSVAVTGGAQYRLMDRYNSDVESYVTAQYTRADGTVFYGYIGALPSTNGAWQQFDQTITLPADATKMTLFHLIGAVGSLTVDNYSLKQIGVQNYMDVNQVLELQTLGYEVGSHTLTHPDLTTLSTVQKQSEIIDSRTALLAAGINLVDTFVYPYGAYNAEVKQISQSAGYIGARSTDRGYNTPNTDIYALKIQAVYRTTTVAEIQSWIDQAAQDKVWLILMFHEIDNDSTHTYGTTAAVLQSTVDYLATANVDVITMREGFAQMGVTVTPPPPAPTVSSALVVSVSTVPISQTVVVGEQGFTFANYVFDTTGSEEDVRLTSLPIAYYSSNTTSPSPTGCQLFDGATAVTTVITISGNSSSTQVTFNALGYVFGKDTVTTLSLKCGVPTNAVVGTEYMFGLDSAQAASYTGAVGVTSGNVVDENLNESAGQFMRVASTGSLSVLLDTNSPAYKNVSGGTTGAELIRIKYSATNESIDLKQVALQLSNVGVNNPADLVGGLVTLWTTEGVQIGTAQFTGSGFATSTLVANGAFRIPKDGSKTLVVKGDIANIGISGPLTASGDFLKVEYDGDNKGLSGNYGVGVASGATIIPLGEDTNPNYGGVRIMAAYPVVEKITFTPPVLIDGANKILYRFKITAVDGDIALYKNTFNIFDYGVGTITLSNYKVFSYTDSGFSSPDVTFSTNGALNVDTFSTVGAADVGLYIQSVSGVNRTYIIPSGASRWFELRADISNVESTPGIDEIVVSPVHDNSFVGMLNAAGVDSTAENNFIWSPISTSTQNSVNDIDFANGYGVLYGYFGSENVVHTSNN